MFTHENYELIDFGGGRKLERFGRYVLDRPCPAAEGDTIRAPAAWSEATARYERTSADRGRWFNRDRLSEIWIIRHGDLCFELKPTDFGHLGVFVEQAENWDWIAGQIQLAAGPPKILNLFAYTGGSTMAAAGAGAHVAHIDSAGSIIKWASRNAELSGLADAPIRWICEDAHKFARREIKRGSRYDGVIIDPPSYGHGPQGEVWKLADHLEPLLEACGELVGPDPAFILLTCHTKGIGPDELAGRLADSVSWATAAEITAGEMSVLASTGHRLNCGVFARWNRASPEQNALAPDDAPPA